MSNDYSVWTKNFSRDWMEHNAGCADVLLVSGLDSRKATALANRLRLTYQDQNVRVHTPGLSPTPPTVRPSTLKG